jgi:hypothetical protein
MATNIAGRVVVRGDSRLDVLGEVCVIAAPECGCRGEREEAHVVSMVDGATPWGSLGVLGREMWSGCAVRWHDRYM